jgi:hypothetical protein
VSQSNEAGQCLGGLAGDEVHVAQGHGPRNLSSVGVGYSSGEIYAVC